MEIEFDPEKSEKNARERGLRFDLTRDAFDWDGALVVEDERNDYGERRFLAFAPMMGERLYVVCYCLRGETRRIISFRKPKEKEVLAYEKASDETPTEAGAKAPDEARAKARDETPDR